MLNHSDNPQLTDLLTEIAPLLAAGDPACPPFGADKLRRILDRVYNRLADEADVVATSQLRRLIAEVLELPEAEAAIDPGRTQRILDRVRLRMAVEDTMVPEVTRRHAAPKSATRAALRAAVAAFFMPRRLAFGSEGLADDGGPAEPA